MPLKLLGIFHLFKKRIVVMRLYKADKPTRVLFALLVNTCWKFWVNWFPTSTDSRTMQISW